MLKIWWKTPEKVINYEDEKFIHYKEAKLILGLEYIKMNIIIFLCTVILRISNSINSDEMSILTVLLFTTLSDFLIPIRNIFAEGIILNKEEEKPSNGIIKKYIVREVYMSLNQFYIIRVIINALPVSISLLTVLKVFHVAFIERSNESFFTSIALIHTLFGSWVSSIYNRVYSTSSVCECQINEEDD